MQTNFAELNKLKNAAKCLERACGGIEEKISALVDPSVVVLKRKLRSDGESCFKKLENIISNISQSMDCVTKQIDTNHNNTDLGSLKTSMISLQHGLSTSNFELQSRLSCLEQEESALNEELKIYNTYLLDNSNLEKKENVTNVVHKKESKMTEEDKKEGFVWNRESHLKYLKAKKIYDDFDKVCKVLMALIPGLTKEDICEYERSKREQSENNSCDMRKKAAERKEDNVKNSTKKNTSSSNGEVKSKKGAQEGGRRKSTKINAGYNEKLKQKLAAWKEEKKDKEIMQQHLDRLMDIKKMNEELYRRLKNEQTKERVMKWKKDKADAALAMERKQQEEERIRQESRSLRANSLIRHYWKQDLEIIKKKKEKKPKENTGQRTIETIKVYAKRDPNRLHKATQQWTARTRQRSSTDSKKTICNIHLVNKWTIPTWRRRC